jgi:hypothetical protein
MYAPRKSKLAEESATPANGQAGFGNSLVSAPYFWVCAAFGNRRHKGILAQGTTQLTAARAKT